MPIYEIIGIIGMALILLAFLLNQLGKWKNEYLIYDFTNLVGSILLFYYAVALDSLPFMIINVVWGIVSLRDVFLDINRNSHRRAGGFWEKWMK